MPTVNKQIADTIIANNGFYITKDQENQDPQVIAVVRYENQFNGNYAYGLCYNTTQLVGYLASPSCIDPFIIAATDKAIEEIKDWEPEFYSFFILNTYSKLTN